MLDLFLLSGLASGTTARVRATSTRRPVLKELAHEIGDSGAVAETIPTAFAGKLWLVFYAMHDEAGHARAEAGAIRTAAARYQEALRVAIFGPWWGRGR